MKNISFVLLFVLFGCESENIPLRPQISVEQSESEENCSITIKYSEHMCTEYRNGYSYFYIQINDFSELEKYKNQVKFLLNKIEETEKKMTIHEQNEQKTIAE